MLYLTYALSDVVAYDKFINWKLFEICLGPFPNVKQHLAKMKPIGVYIR